MKRKLNLEAFYPFPPEHVWQALTNSQALSKWLMPNDFKPLVGHKFQFRTKPAPGFDGIVNCEVLEIDAPRRLSFTWKGGPVDTIVSFVLEPAGSGTKLHFEQKEFEGTKAVLISYFLGSGWKGMLRQKLPKVLDNMKDLDLLETEPNSCNLSGNSV